MLLLVVLGSVGAWAQTTTFKYTSSEKLTRFDEFQYFVGATGVVSHDWDADTGEGVVVYEGTVTELSSNALQYQATMTALVIPEGVTTLGFQSVQACPQLSSVSLPKSLMHVKGQAFYYTGFEKGKFIIDDLAWWCSITFDGIDSNPLNYAKHVYSDEDTEITDLVIPEGVTSIGPHAFVKCEGIKSVTFPSTLTAIGNYAFYQSGLESVAIPESVTEIEEYTFSNCANLKSVTIPEGVTKIGFSAFAKCGIESLTLPSTISEMSQSFYQCEQLASLTLTDGISNLGGSFYSCPNLTTLNIPGSVKTVGYQDFNGCTGIETITLNEGTEEITFQGCENLANINFPSTLKKVTVTGAKKLETVTLSEGIEEIISFNDCSNLNTINIPSSVTYVGTFKNCNALQTVIVADLKSWCEARHYDSYWYGPQKIAGKLYLGSADTELTALAIPEGTSKIAEGSFIGMTGITSVSIPPSVNLIGSGAFRDCTGLSAVVIPEGTETLSYYAFYGCTSLTELNIPSTVTRIEGEALCGMEATATVYCKVNPENLYWAGYDFADYLMPDKATQFHVFNADAWTAKYPNANVTFVSDAALTITLPLHSGEGSYWATYYNLGQNLQADADTKVYAVALEGETISLNEVADRIINDGQAVVLQSANSTATLSFAASASAGDYTANSLKGANEKIYNSYGQPYYVLNCGSNGVGFYRLERNAAIGARKGYLKLESATRSFIRIEGTTAIKALRTAENSGRQEYYSLDGRRIQNPAKGLYIKDGRKVIIK